MKKWDWIIIVASIFFVWGVDYYSKLWALANINGLQFHGPFGFVLVRNPGAILGAFSHLSPVLRIVSLSTGGAFLIFIYASIQYLLPKRSFVLRLGMSILLGGILGNVTDRILAGSVVDFLVFRIEKLNWLSPAFNPADALQWVGYFMVVYSLLREGNQLWPNDNERKKVWVLPRFQIRFTFVIMAIGLAFVIISGVFSYTYLKVTIRDIATSAPPDFENRYLIPFLETFGIVVIGFMFMLFIIGKLLSHRMAGPIYAFELFLEDIMAGKDRPLRLRDGDDFRHLEELADRMREKVRKNLEQSKTNITIPPESIEKIKIPEDLSTNE